ncbi:preprotein translocase subunit SecE [Candidatus Desulfofervidus auxilii]|uniref:Protein translocase subunit SecE n=1 Tax=Desulfofervidus auxilii TaxID=1621989 RepID=A0A7C1VND3_DESA2|nr:preprotein translocase subunit SecE [Candidatus Desulfofervidus auxilii]CAD7771106.1 MAG: Protein translocase subunit SecE [Candidatus Methanoperedenaceae archaeon GB50]CAD7772614.1 Protein translocase subunit SecE [Candidatus Methanoperedenaceae archaeon GB37]HEB73971.1 preprotein translocase subunit SecE [Candidatus Desulfofervidus auxilii]HEC67742.1 preprotein translocase subunit SecE [Candidatus Desulfofervidus auxilii]
MPKKKRETKKETIKVPGEVLKTFKGSSLNWWGQTRQFLRETKVELKKVTWPSKKELIGSTVVVIIFVLLIAAYFGIIDLIYTTIIGKFLG